ncbi:MAG: hypothetical protein GX643_01585 [Acidimicrobiales bacterium]|nr:hypothetical protein [Acidimicrobiales bacterium]
MTSTASKGSRSTVGWWPWVLMAVVVVALLAVGSLGGDPPTLEERAQNLEESIRCPSCASQSVANSDAPSAEAVRVLIAERLEAGDSNEEIRDYVASRYPNGRQLLLDPTGEGFGALVWALPVVAVIVAVAALVRRFGDWRPGELQATEEDRDLVAAALARRGEAGADGGNGPDGGSGPYGAPSVDAAGGDES